VSQRCKEKHGEVLFALVFMGGKGRKGAPFYLSVFVFKCVENTNLPLHSEGTSVGRSVFSSSANSANQLRFDGALLSCS
jgi:hypothetical protein